MKVWTLYFLILSFFSTWSQASDAPVVDASKIKIDLRNALYVDYTSRAWNRDSSAQDSAFLIIRDANSGQLFSLEMRETEPNSSRFVGQYRLGANQNSTGEATVEVYVPPQKLRNNDKRSQIVAQMIRDGIILRKPYFFRMESGRQRITVYDSKTQALEAYRYFVRTGQSAQVLNPNLLETQARAQLQAEAEQKAQQEAAGQIALAEQERLLKRQTAEREARQRQLSEQQRREQRERAKRIAAEALALYNQQNFAEASKKFEQSIELDPSDTSFYFQYGVTLYRLDKNEKSIAYLNQAEDAPTHEKDLFLGLNYLKIKNNDSAYTAFERIATHPELGPTGVFYMGIIDFSKENLDQAQLHFEKVLEISKDPKMDQAADNYIEQILNLKRYRELQSKKWTLTGTLGFGYDSNILTVSPDVVASDLSGFRTSYGGNLEYRPIFTEKHEFLGQFSISDIYSLNSSFQGSADLQNVDPQLIGLVLPYRWKGELRGKTAQVGVTPAFRTLFMNADGAGQREQILNSSGVTTDVTTINSEKLTSIYALELRIDDSLTSTAGDDNADATYLGFTGTYTIKDSVDASKAWLSDFGLATNAAQGRNQKYHQISVGGGFLQPGYFKALWIAKLAATHKMYFETDDGRADTLLNATVVAQKQLAEKVQGSMIFSANQNSSNQAALNYNQFLLMGQVNWQTSF